MEKETSATNSKMRIFLVWFLFTFYITPCIFIAVRVSHYIGLFLQFLYMKCNNNYNDNLIESWWMLWNEVKLNCVANKAYCLFVSREFFIYFSFDSFFLHKVVESILKFLLTQNVSGTNFLWIIIIVWFHNDIFSMGNRFSNSNAFKKKNYLRCWSRRKAVFPKIITLVKSNVLRSAFHRGQRSSIFFCIYF